MRYRQNQEILKDLQALVYPYVFLLKEGDGIKKDFLDYSLLMLQVGCPETIKSPSEDGWRRNPLIADCDFLGTGFSDDILRKL